MGLDMYLDVSTYVQKPQEWQKPEARAEYEVQWKKLLPLLPAEPSEEAFGVKLSYTVAYWRKANAIHQWFVDNVQDGEDNCQRSWVSIDKLNELLSVCHEVIKNSELIEGHVSNGQTFTSETGWVNNYEEGQVIARPEVVAELLPTQEGFFFGGTGYDQWYLEDVKSTVTQIQSVLAQYQDKSVDFYYQASW